MTKVEVAYAVETALRLHNVALVHEGVNRLTAIPLAELRSRKARESGAADKRPNPDAFLG
ncbi:MAG: hypothetical protein MZU97_18605 [Bacillus subtilis]|nr:hypothetical protein [Bacillus subtilis]